MLKKVLALLLLLGLFALSSTAQCSLGVVGAAGPINLTDAAGYPLSPPVGVYAQSADVYSLINDTPCDVIVRIWCYEISYPAIHSLIGEVGVPAGEGWLAIPPVTFSCPNGQALAVSVTKLPNGVDTLVIY